MTEEYKYIMSLRECMEAEETEKRDLPVVSLRSVENLINEFMAGNSDVIKPNTFNVKVHFIEYSKMANKNDKELTIVIPEGKVE